MRRAASRLVVLTVTAAVLLIGCRRPGVAAGSTPLVPPPEEFCWWRPYRTAQSPDSVAARTSRAFSTLGLTGATWTRQADTAWAQAGPTALADSSHAAGPYSARVVAFRRGDSTSFRTLVVTPSNRGSETIPFCGDILRTAKAGAVTPTAESPDDTLAVWRRRP
jgi:hypothetical protein